MHPAATKVPPDGVRNRHLTREGARPSLAERGPLSIVIPLQRRIVG